VDLADAALRHAEHVADLTQRHVLYVEQDGDTPLALRQSLEGVAKPLLGFAERACVLGVAFAVGAGQHVDPFDRAVFVTADEGVERADIGHCDVVELRGQLCGGDADHVGELLARRAASVKRDESLVGAGNVALPAPQRSWRPVVTSQLVEYRAVDSRPGKLLERRTLRGVVAVDRADQRLEPARDEVLNVTAGRDLADLLVDDVLHHRGEGENESIAEPSVAGFPVFSPQCEHLLWRDALPLLCAHDHSSLPVSVSPPVNQTTALRRIGVLSTGARFAIFRAFLAQVCGLNADHSRRPSVGSLVCPYV